MTQCSAEIVELCASVILLGETYAGGAESLWSEKKSSVVRAENRYFLAEISGRKEARGRGMNRIPGSSLLIRIKEKIRKLWL